MAAELVKVTVLVLALKVPPLLSQAPLPPRIVKLEVVAAFKIDPDARVKVLIVVLLEGSNGSKVVVEASGMLTLSVDTGATPNSQFVPSVQTALTSPSQVTLTDEVLANDRFLCPKVVYQVVTTKLDVSTQLFAVSKLDLPKSVPEPGVEGASEAHLVMLVSVFPLSSASR